MRLVAHWGFLLKGEGTQVQLQQQNQQLDRSAPDKVANVEQQRHQPSGHLLNAQWRAAEEKENPTLRGVMRRLQIDHSILYL